VVVVLALAACAVVTAAVFLIVRGTGDVATEPEEKSDQPFEPRRSARDLEQGLELMRRERGGLPAEIEAAGAGGEAKAFLEARAEFERRQTPDQAAEHAREKLAEIDELIAKATTGEERERLERRRRLVESVLAKLERMGK
jgi:hypothetical protein